MRETEVAILGVYPAVDHGLLLHPIHPRESRYGRKQRLHEPVVVSLEDQVRADDVVGVLVDFWIVLGGSSPTAHIHQRVDGVDLIDFCPDSSRQISEDGMVWILLTLPFYVSIRFAWNIVHKQLVTVASHTWHIQE
jgi:hypothetical protein